MCTTVVAVTALFKASTSTAARSSLQRAITTRNSTTCTSGIIITMPASQPASLLACNVYVSAGQRSSHERILLQLLREAQSTSLSLSADATKSADDDDNNGIATTREEHHAALLDSLKLEQKRLFLSSTKRLPPVMIVHAYADPVYNRSSFHLAGTRANAIANVASALAISAIQMLRRENNELETAANDDCTSGHQHHPFVGYVDHVSVMPLISPTQQNVGSHEVNDFQPNSASGWAARAIGKALEDTMIDGERLVDEVYYYGDAQPLGTPLATVRRERTRFFRTGGCSDPNDTIPPTDRRNTPQVATVGAPPEFVENYNIRLTRHVSKSMAQSLTRHVRERNGGLVNVEALTLPYSCGRWEVACNLLRPNTSTTAHHVAMAVQEWERHQQKTTLLDDDDSHAETARPLKLVEHCYSVGATTEQCLQALISCADDNEKRRKHDETVALQLKEFLQQDN